MDITISISGQDILSNPAVAEAIVALAKTVSGESIPSVPVDVTTPAPASIEQVASAMTTALQNGPLATAPQNTPSQAVQSTPAQVVQNTPLAVVPTAPPAAYTLEQLALAAAPLMDAGKMQELISLLQSYGVQALQQLPAEKYNDFAVAIRGMGAQI